MNANKQRNIGWTQLFQLGDPCRQGNSGLQTLKLDIHERGKALADKYDSKKPVVDNYSCAKPLWTATTL